MYDLDRTKCHHLSVYNLVGYITVVMVIWMTFTFIYSWRHFNLPSLSHFSFYQSFHLTQIYLAEPGAKVLHSFSPTIRIDNKAIQLGFFKFKSLFPLRRMSE